MAKAITGLAAKAPVLINGLVNSARPKLNTFWHYARIELAPPTPADIPHVSNQIQSIIKSAKTGAWKNVTVKDAWLNTLVTAEIAFWFFVGECIAKGTIVGYQV